MLKIFYVFVIYLAVGYAVKKKTEVSSADIQQKKDYSGVSVKTISKNKTEITWNEDAENPLKVTFTIQYEKDKKNDSVNLENLCGTHKEGTFEHSVQLFILKFFANAKSCPIKKGAKATFNIPTTYTYDTDYAEECGPYDMEVKLFTKKDSSAPIITGKFKGKVTDCK